MVTRAGAATALALALTLASACDVPPGPCGLRRCDVRDPACQVEVVAATGCLRGEGAPFDVPIFVVERQDFLDAQLAFPPPPEEEARIVLWNRALSLLGLAEPLPSTDTLEANLNNVAAFYTTEPRQIVLIDDGMPLDSFYAIGTLVHEAAHAIQDARWYLDRVSDTQPPELDNQLAVGAVTEGEATMVEDFALLELFGADRNQVDWDRIFDSWQYTARWAARRSPLPVSLAWGYFRYPFGSELVKDALDAGGWPAVDDMMLTPPVSARQVMEGYGAAEPTGGPWVEDLGSDAVPVLTGRFSYFDSDRLGAWIVDVFAGRLEGQHPDRFSSGWSNDWSDPARALTDDRFSIFVDQATAESVAIWRLRFSASVFEAAWWVFDALQVFAADPRLRAWQQGRDLIIVAAPSEQVLDEIPEYLTFQAVPASLAPSTGAARGLPRAFPRGCARRHR